MATKSKRAPLTDEQREAKREAERKMMAEAVEQLKTSEGWMTWLAVRRHFHSYSFNNQLLIVLQKPESTRVTGYRAWQALGRQVRKGEKGIFIWAPMPPSKKVIEAWQAAGSPSPRPRTMFRLAPVFDLSQVDELPPPAVVKPLDFPFDLDMEGFELAGLLDADGPLFSLAESIGYTLELAENPGVEARGFCQPGKKLIRVFTDASPNGQAATAIHEFAHALVREDKRDDDPELDYAAEELIVESVAFTVLATLGVEHTKAVPYLASWSERADLDVIRQHAALVDRLAKRIEDHVLAEGAGDWS